MPNAIAHTATPTTFASVVTRYNKPYSYIQHYACLLYKQNNGIRTHLQKQILNGKYLNHFTNECPNFKHAGRGIRLTACKLQADKKFRMQHAIFLIKYLL